jgi:hypothetical protein
VTFDEALAAVSDVVRASVARTRPQTHTERDDRMQAARIGVWHGWMRYDGRSSSWRTWAGVWARAYAEREAWGAASRRNGEKATARHVTHEELGDVLPDPAPSPERRVEGRQALELALRPWLRVTKKQRRRGRWPLASSLKAIALGDSCAEVARRHGVTTASVSLATVKRRREARAALEAA